MELESIVQVETVVPKVMRTPREVGIEITARCNLHCRYCYFFENPAVDYRDLPAEEWLRFFDELGRLQVMEVTIAGGEPFIRHDLPQVLEGIVRNRMRFSLLSNGSLIEDEIASFIASTGRCNYVQVSIDGSSAQIHDIVRGKGSFEGALRGIRLLKRHGIPVAVRVTIHHYNVHDLENIASLLLEGLGLPSFSTNSAGYLGSCQRNAGGVLLTIEERGVAMETLLRLNEKYHGRISAMAGPLAEARVWVEMEKARREGADPFLNGGRLTACGCPANKIAVRSDGVIVPCSMLAHIRLGRINQDSLETVWRESQALNRLRSRQIIPLTDFEFCAGCEYLPYCTGNCPALAYGLTGEVDHPSPDACLRRFIEAGGRLPGI
jgi:SynChlorMet cassette radical SAM/SPASM protein ScmE